MVPKQTKLSRRFRVGFRAVLFRMVPKQFRIRNKKIISFRAVLFRMVPKPIKYEFGIHN